MPLHATFAALSRHARTSEITEAPAKQYRRGMAFTLRLTVQEQELLNVLAEREGISQYEVVQRVVGDQARSPGACQSCG